jgi:hypothetical protein
MPKFPLSTKLKIKGLDARLGKRSQSIYLRVPFRKPLLLITSLNLVIIGLVFALQRFLPPQIPLFYGMPEGEGQLATSLLLFLPSLISLAIIFINISIGLVIKDEFLKKVLVASCAPVTFFSLITTVKIFFLVSSL